MLLRSSIFITACLVVASQAAAVQARTTHAMRARAASGTFTIIHAFQGMPDGGNPQGGVFIDSAGNIFGNTAGGGTQDGGTVYELSPSASGYTQHILHSYTPNVDGGGATGAIAIDQAGNIFSAAAAGGLNHSAGTVIELKPTKGGGYKETAVHSFVGSDGRGPVGGVVLGGKTVYATTQTGGALNLGTVVSLKGKQLQTTLLYSFGPHLGDGTQPNSRLVLGPDAAYYSTTQSMPSGYGTVFRFDPATGQVTYPWTFTSTQGGVTPNGVTVDQSGNLYGTTNAGGRNVAGVVYKLTRRGAGYKQQLLHAFTDTSGDGGYPTGTLALVGSTLFGTTTDGGLGCGTIFRVDTSGKNYATLYAFNCSTDGIDARGDLLWSNGGIYGVMSSGGSGYSGTLYRFVP